ncbi:poly adp-ribose polymerase family [Anaeramoeba flamelloides]|uniref:Poly adp-ribose polymerase family n=1 Tax=Anaeramoeba flamelloides TaxID=1746091 RepID=A0AAV7ZNU4_9EUKA|nr:poly adp-ribose polymerase family member parp [Anaeramoeba flamelloides]KAJ6242446.1 poly adp-ribose polymerase family [Anaeramoeba flamelloides]
MSLSEEVTTLKQRFSKINNFKIIFDEFEKNINFVYNHEEIRYRFSSYLFAYPKTNPFLITENEKLNSIVEKTNNKKPNDLLSLTKTLIQNLADFLNIKINLNTLDRTLSIQEPKESFSESTETSSFNSETDSQIESDGYYSDENDFDYILNSEQTQGGYKLLEQDLEQAKEVFTGTQIEYFKKLKSLKMELNVSFLGPDYADALGIDERKPINLVIDFPTGYIESSVKPKVELFQGDKSKKQTFGLEFQLREIIYAFFIHFKDHYERLAKERMKENKKEKIEEESSDYSDEDSEKEIEIEKKKKEKMKPSWNEEGVLELQNMGFDRFEAIGGLLLSGNEVFTACSLLIENDRRQFEQMGRQAVNELNKINGDLEFELGEVRNSRSLRTTISTSSEVNLESFIPGNNFILDLYDYATARVMNCTNYCIMCGNWLKTQGLKPTCCDKPACIFKHQEMGLGVNVSAEIAKTPDLVDFVITTAYAAATSNRSENIFNPFPPEFLKQGGKVKDFTRLQKVLNSFPSVDEMASVGNNEKTLRKYLNFYHPECYSLLRWLLTTNRAHLIKIPKQYQLSEFGTDYQWVLLSTHPKKEAKFLDLKKKFKNSVYAFHGSPVENWFSILRVGLKNYSNTKNMICGAAMGPGIYMAAQPSTSMGYARSGQGWSKSRICQGSFNCMAVCEIIQDQTVKKTSVYVIQNEDLVMTRMFIVNFKMNYSSNFNTDSLSTKIPKIFSQVRKTRW